MRVPPSAEVPASVPQKRSLGPRLWLIGGVLAVIFLLTSLRGVARFYTDYLWFDEVGFTEVWRGLLSARIVPALAFSVGFFVLMWLNLVIADRLAPRYRAMGPEDEVIERYRSQIAPYAGVIRIGVAAFFAFVMGSGVASQWEEWVLFRNAVDFGVSDPQFGRDVGFYVFRLPFLEFLSDWLFAALLVVLLVVTVFHYVNGGIRLQSPYQHVTPQVKAHLSVILALMAFTKTFGYWLGRYALNFSSRGAVDGASYTDVNAQLPALNFLMIISVAAAVLFIVNIWRRGWVLPVIAVGLWAFMSLVVGTVYPAYIQRFQVQPNELDREAKYIERNIEATRAAFGLDGIEERPFDYSENLTTADVESNISTLENARLWDPSIMRSTYRATQELKTFYTFEDVDVDRYRIGDETLPVMIGARELDQASLPSGTFTNRHLVYTHGYAAVAAAANGVANGNAPSFVLEGIPPEGELKLGEPGVYFGEQLDGFVVVGTKTEEFEPASAPGGGEAADATTRYTGTGGVEASSFLRRAALSLRFGSWDLFVSGQLTEKSRVVYQRDVRDRVEAAAPFLRYDADPYPVVLGDRMLWVLDAYTTTNRYPYSQQLRPNDLPVGSDLATSFNYVRNSVKATVDAYDGTVRFYVIDPKDPIARAWRKAFPDLFSDADELPEGLAAHFRYAEDGFRAQTEQYSLYHMTDPQVFYNKQDLWDIAPRAEGAVLSALPGVATTTAPGNDGGRNSTLQSSGAPIEPLYSMMQLPGEEGQEFVLIRPYVPRSKDNQLSAFLIARSDERGYGELVSYETPIASETPSPARAATLIETDSDISRVFSLLDQRGSQVTRGNVQLIPIEDSIVYLRPIFVSARNSFPRFRYVAATYGERAVLAESIDDAVAQLFEGAPPPETVVEPGTSGDGGTTPPETTPPTTDEVPDEVPALLTAAEEAFAAADAALKAGDLEEYARQVAEAESLVARATALLGASGTAESAPTTTAPPATTAISEAST